MEAAGHDFSFSVLSENDGRRVHEIVGGPSMFADAAFERDENPAVAFSRRRGGAHDIAAVVADDAASGLEPQQVGAIIRDFHQQIRQPSIRVVNEVVRQEFESSGAVHGVVAARADAEIAAAVIDEFSDTVKTGGPHGIDLPASAATWEHKNLQLREIHISYVLPVQ